MRAFNIASMDQEKEIIIRECVDFMGKSLVYL